MSESVLEQGARTRGVRADGETTRAGWGVKPFTLILTFVGLLVVLGVYLVWTRYQVYTLGVELSRETIRYRALLDEQKKLRLELSTLKRPARIRKEAAERLGMQVPAPQDIVEIR